ncbi:MAG: glycosyltransferase family 2 protein [Chitinophagaceae bacterium]|nr:MAG: glycosyltransferase family 2 protein [Chitinophagaceae bacterium]
MEKVPVVSVLIPTYNYAHCLDEAITSVLTQTFTSFELIIIDDCSKDNTDEVVKKYLQDPRVRYFKNERNLGLVGNWNKCVSMAGGKYIKLLCADDKFRNDLLMKMVDAMESHPTVSLVCSNKQIFGSTLSEVKLPLQYFHKGQEIINNTLTTYGWLGEPTCVMFRSANLHVGAFRTDVTWLPDWEMWLRQLSVGDAYLIPEPLAFVRIHEQQVTKTVMKRYINYFEEYDLSKNIRDKNGYDIDTSGIDMNQVVKFRAEKCALAMYKLLPFVFKKAERKIFAKAAKIAWKEGVLVSSLKQLFVKKPAKTILTIENIRPEKTPAQNVI